MSVSVMTAERVNQLRAQLASGKPISVEDSREIVRYLRADRTASDFRMKAKSAKGKKAAAKAGAEAAVSVDDLLKELE